jgi:site-specific DNA-methyltransferase (adenine-specific)
VCLPKIYKAFDDSHTPDAEYFKELSRVAKKTIIWGGNYFLDNLGATECLIVWDKKRRGLNFADCEIAWTNIKEPCRIFEWKWNGMLQEDMKNKEYRIHPTQKPVALYRWLLEHYAKEGDKILDTHVGSASSLIACREMGFKYVGFEIDPDYYHEAKKRLDQAENQVNIFDLL